MLHLSTLKSRIVLLSCIIIAALLLVSSCDRKSTALTPIRIGWQTSWATQAQMAMALKYTNVLERNGLVGELKSFTYGGPLSEAALANEIDVLFAADQPAINLIARGAKWKIISKSVNFRDAILVPVTSKAQTVADLRGKKIVVPFGSGAHRIVIELLTAAGLNVEKDVQLVNLDVTEINATVQAGVTDTANGLWRGEIAAVANWDPNIAEFEQKNLARVLVEKQLFGVTAMSEKFIQSHRAEAIGFLKALHEALYYYAQHQTEANNWYTKEVNISFDSKNLDRSASFDQNLKARTITDIQLGFSDDDVRTLQASSDFAFNAGLIKSHPAARELVDYDLLQIATEGIRGGKYEANSIRPKEQ